MGNHLKGSKRQYIRVAGFECLEGRPEWDRQGFVVSYQLTGDIEI